jgi:hypothetical protein
VDDKNLRESLGLVPSKLLEGKAAAFDARRGELPRHYDLSLLDAPLSGRALKFYLLLTEMPSLLGEGTFSAEQVLYSRYYWFVRFARLRQAMAGHDAGLEQQALQILEQPPTDCELDWLIVERIESAASKAATARLHTEGVATICATLLDNADLDVSLDARTGTITLDFTVGGSLELVVFRCSRFWRFRYVKAGDEAECVFVGETRVSVIEGSEAVWEALREDWQDLGGQTPSRLFRVTTDGEAMIDILCEDFEWWIEPPS